MMSTRAICALAAACALLASACGATDSQAVASSATGAEGSAGHEFVSDHGSSYVFDTGFDTWVSFADAVVTFQIAEVSNGIRQENITGTTEVQQFLTLEVVDVLWRSDNAEEIPTPLVVQGEAMSLRGDEVISQEPGQVVGDQVFLGAVAYSPNEDVWFTLSNSIVRVDSNGDVLTPGSDAMLASNVDGIVSALGDTARLPADYSIEDPIRRAIAYQDELASRNTEPAPTVDPDFEMPCPIVDADPIPQALLDECEARLNAAADE